MNGERFIIAFSPKNIFTYILHQLLAEMLIGQGMALLPESLLFPQQPRVVENLETAPNPCGGEGQGRG